MNNPDATGHQMTI